MPRILTALLAALIAVGARAEDENSIVNKLINSPSWNVQGGSSEIVDDAAVQGGKAIRITVASKGANPWDVQATNAVNKHIKKGDVIFVAFWARSEVPAEGQPTADISLIQMQLSAAPYTAVFGDRASVGAKWAMYYASGTADRDYDPGAVTLTLHLASAKQTIDLGPVFIVDFGPNYDRSKLPKNALPSAAGVAPKAPPAEFATAEARFAAELARIRALLPVHGQLLNDPSVATIGTYGAGQTSQLIPAPEIPGGQALRVAVDKGGAEPYLIGTASPVYGDIHKDDVLLLAFYARTTEATNEAQSGVISAYNVQQSASPYVIAVGTAALVPLNTWRVFYASAVAKMDYPSGTATLTAQIGSRKQTIDFGPAFVLDLGPGVNLSSLPVNTITYPGREPNAPWRAAAEKRIREVRMGDLRVAVSDASGKPVPGAAVHFAMQKHLFRFGTFVGMNIAGASGPDADKLRASFLENFNFATTPIYWSDWGWQNPAQRAADIASMQWLHGHGYDFRAHTVIYPREDLTPSKIKKLAGDPAAVHAAILDHVRDVVPVAAKNGVYAFDVVNEPRDGDYLPQIAGPDIFPDVYKLAHQLAPDAHLFVNDYAIIEGGGQNQKNIDYYHRWIETMLAKGAPVSGIGFQGHFGADLTDPARLIAIFDDFARYKMPIEISEFDVDTTDKEAQADYTRDILTAVFSHPATDAFVMWGWWEGDHWKPSAAMLRRDWSEKPNFKVWRKLIYHDWWTDETRTSGADGTAAVRAFFGDYRITVTAGGRTVEQKVSFVPGTGPVAFVLR
ncbi:MAG TPA: endo-1,4-beta-xylanase [Rhizomicrobium sp.]|nr:endo-1,4-beta-xylanase [Rhizomicrobium sp.]